MNATSNLNMRHIKLQAVLVAGLIVICMGLFAPKAHAVAGLTPASCQAARKYKFLGIIPTWYEYVQDYTIMPVTSSLDDGSCGINHTSGDTADNLKKDAVAIGLAVIDILLRVGALVAVGAVMLGGYKYISSQGEPKNLEAAMATIVNAAIGLAIVLAATVLVAFIGNTLGG